MARRDTAQRFLLLCHLLGWLSLACSLLLFPLVWCAFLSKLGQVAVLTNLPMWLWALGGVKASLFSWITLRHRMILLVPLAWTGLTLSLADEAKTLWNGNHPPPVPGHSKPHQGTPTFRVITLNCAAFLHGNPMEDIARWHPDIVLLQDAYPHQVRLITLRLFGNEGFHTNTCRTTAVVSRWPITREIATLGTRNQQVTIRMPGPVDVEIVNLHLPSASTDLRFWKRSTWANHHLDRIRRLHEIDFLHNQLRLNPSFPISPTLLGGDFNATATDVSHDRLSDHFQDSFLQAGSGWGNTYHRRFPILRIDYLYHSFHFTAVRSKTVESPRSDHRMVISDYLQISPP